MVTKRILSMNLAAIHTSSNVSGTAYSYCNTHSEILNLLTTVFRASHMPSTTSLRRLSTSAHCEMKSRPSSLQKGGRRQL